MEIERYLKSNQSLYVRGFIMVRTISLTLLVTSAISIMQCSSNRENSTSEDNKVSNKSIHVIVEGEVAMVMTSKIELDENCNVINAPEGIDVSQYIDACKDNGIMNFAGITKPVLSIDTVLVPNSSEIKSTLKRGDRVSITGKHSNHLKSLGFHGDPIVRIAGTFITDHIEADTFEIIKE